VTTRPTQAHPAIDELARIADGIRKQTQILEQQQDALVQLDARVASLASATDGQPSADVLESLAGIRSSLKSMRGTEKRGMARLTELLSRISVALDPSVDQRFLDVARPLLESRRTMLDYDRLFTLWEAARNAASVEGSAAEVGTFQGGSAALLSEALKLFAGGPRDLHVVDTFEGHLDASFTEHDDEHQRGKFGQARFDDVRAFLAAFAGTRVYMGDGPAVVAGWPDRRYCLVHLDVDLYKPTIDCLEYFGPRVAPGGVIVVDDYGAASCPGIGKAVHEYVDRTTGFHTWRLRVEQIVLVKR
jgi:O-methyltransferase